MKISSTFRLAGAVAWTAVLFACTEGTPAGPGAALDHAGPLPETAHVTLCKVGSGATFDVTDDGVTTQWMLADGECQIVSTSPILHGVPTPPKTVAITEIVPAGTVLDSIVADSLLGALAVVRTTLPAGSDTWTGILHDDIGWVITFYNRVLPPPGEGCTPGFWKQPQHLDWWGATGYSPGDLFADVGFDDAFSGLTLFDVVGLRGGGVNRLGAHAVAALLNAASPDVDYELTAAEVIQAFNAAYPDGDIDGTKNLFVFNNELGCSLN